MLKKMIIVLAFVTIIVPAAFGQDQEDVNVEFEGIYWFSELTARARASGETSRGTEFDLQRDTGLGDRDIPSGRFTWFTGPESRLFLDYAEREFHSQRVLDRQIVFRDRVYDVGASLETDLTFRFARLGWIWQFITSSNGEFKLGTVLEARALVSEVALTGQVAGLGETKTEEDIEVGLPTLGIAVDYNPAESLNIFLRASGFYYGRLGYFGDGEAGIKLIPGRTLSISGGYRYMSLEGREDGGDSFVRFIFKGPFAAASLRF